MKLKKKRHQEERDCQQISQRGPLCRKEEGKKNHWFEKQYVTICTAQLTDI